LRVAHRPRQAQRYAAQRQTICSAQTAQEGKLISQVEIPAFIPRQDLLEQLTRWAQTAAQDDGHANFGLPMRVVKLEDDNGVPNGFIVEIVRDGITESKIGIVFDDDVTSKYEWVGRGADGFPSLEGKVTEIRGKHLMIRKLDDNKVDEQLRSAIRGFCEALVSALNKYYAFGSAFTDDTT
jgi:hypothetical protein